MKMKTLIGFFVVLFLCSMVYAAPKQNKKNNIGLSQAEIAAMIRDGVSPKELLTCIENGNNQKAFFIIESGMVDLSEKDEYGYTPLMWAIHYDRKEIANKIIAASSDDAIKAKTGKEETALMLAIRKGRNEIAKEIINVSSVEAINATNSKGQTALMMTVNKEDMELTQYLLKAITKSFQYKVDLNIKDNNMRTVFEYALKQRVKYHHLGTSAYNRELLKHLIQAANNNDPRYDVRMAINEKGDTLLRRAIILYDAEAARWILEQVKLGHSWEGLVYSMALIDAMEEGDSRFVEMLVNAEDKDGNYVYNLDSAPDQNTDTPLMMALKKHTAYFRLFFKAKDKKGNYRINNLKCDNGETLLTEAIKRAVQDPNIYKDDVISVLINDDRININEPNDYGELPIMLAIENNQVDIVEALLNARDSSNKRKIDLTLKNDKGQTPREYAIEHGSRQIFELIF